MWYRIKDIDIEWLWSESFLLWQKKKWTYVYWDWNKLKNYKTNFILELTQNDREIYLTIDKVDNLKLVRTLLKEYTNKDSKKTQRLIEYFILSWLREEYENKMTFKEFINNNHVINESIWKSLNDEKDNKINLYVLSLFKEQDEYCKDWFLLESLDEFKLYLKHVCQLRTEEDFESLWNNDVRMLQDQFHQLWIKHADYLIPLLLKQEVIWLQK